MNQSYEIKRVTVDMYNPNDQDILAEASYNSLLPLVENASHYTAVVESATVDLSSMVLNPNPGFSILIFNNDKTGKYPNLPEINNYFSFDSPIREVEEIIMWLYSITHKKALPYDLGSFEVDSEGYFSFQLPDPTAYTSGDIEVFFNSRLKEIFPEFLTDEVIYANGNAYWKLNATGVINPAQKQSKYTLSRLMTAVSIRFYTDMQTTPHMVHNPALNTITQEKIFATIALNNETFDVLNKFNMVYSPTQYRHVTMVNDQPIQNFKLWVKIYYKGGYYQFHTMKPGDYSVINVAFHPRQITEE